MSIVIENGDFYSAPIDLYFVSQQERKITAFSREVACTILGKIDVQPDAQYKPSRLCTHILSANSAL